MNLYMPYEGEGNDYRECLVVRLSWYLASETKRITCAVFVLQQNLKRLCRRLREVRNRLQKDGN